MSNPHRRLLSHPLALALTLWAAHALSTCPARADFVTPVLLPDYDGSRTFGYPDFPIEVVYPTPITIEFSAAVATSSATGMATPGPATEEWNYVQFTFHDPADVVSFTMDFDIFADAESGGLAIGSDNPFAFRLPIDARSVSIGVVGTTPVLFIAPFVFLSVGPIVVTTRSDPGPRPDVATPEPAGLVMIGLGGVGLAGVAWRGRRRTG